MATPGPAPEPQRVGSVPQPPQPVSVGGSPAPRPQLPAGRYTYKDPPRYPVIAQYEGRLKDNYRRTLRGMSRALGQQLARYIAQAAK